MDEIKEVKDIYSALSAFFKQQQEYCASGSGTPPELQSLLDSMQVQELLTYVDSLSQSAVGYQIGVAQEALSTGIAVIREYDICNLTKSELYGNFESDAEDEVIFYDQTGVYNAGVLSGAPSNGSQS